jgi:diguanylate cyclase (GGDEF)-like protein/PAS domain S-box-containing protein
MCLACSRRWPSPLRRRLTEELPSADDQLGVLYRQWLDSLVANVPGAIYRCALSSDWEMEFMSREIKRITGYPAAEFVGNNARTYASVIHPDDRDYVECEVDRCVARRQPFVLEYRVLTRDGGSCWVHEQGQAVFAEEGEVAYLDGAIFDISDRKLLEAQLEQLAYSDSLTGLPNRVHFAEHVELALARARRSDSHVALLFLDLDDFKLVNDSFGHAAGDRLLVEVAQRLRAAVRETDVVARQGGDEFLVLMADLPADDGEGTASAEQAAVAMARRVRTALGELVVLEEAEVYVTASIGISVSGRGGSDTEDLLKQADMAMYQAKNAGRDRCALSGEETGAARAQLSLAGRLRRAIELDEFELHYQPLVELESGRMLGVEALIRWFHPERGLVMPDEFIPLAERTGAIQQITEWVVAEACRQMALWQAEGLDIYVSVNLPARFWRPTAMHSVMSMIEAFGVSPERLMVEITESAVMDSHQNTDAIIDQLRRRGVQVAIDDFGTGHSSLARLNQMAVTTLKIDRSFVSNIAEDQHSAVLVGGIVDLARSLGLSPLAEGVETAEQRDFLVGRGCEMGQGYFFSKPLRADLVRSYAPPEEHALALPEVTGAT